MRYSVEIAGRAVTVDVTESGVVVDGQATSALLDGRPGDLVRRLEVGGRSWRIVASPGEGRGRWRLQAAGERLEAVVLDERSRAIQAMVGQGASRSGVSSLKAPMPGLVVRVLVREGEEVRAGQGLVVVEAMKMENELRAAGAGVVRRVHVSAGAAVEKGALLVELGESSGSR